MSKKHHEQLSISPELELLAQEYAARENEIDIAINASISAAAGISGIELIKTSIDNLKDPLSLLGIGAGILLLAAAAKYGQVVVEATRRLHELHKGKIPNEQ